MPGRVLRDAAHHGPVFRVGVAEGLELVGFVDGVGDAARNLQALFQEEGLGLLQGLVVHDQQVAVRLEVDLVHVQLVGDDLPGRLEPGAVLHLLDLVGADIDGNLETLVGRPGREDGEQRQEHGCGAEKAFASHRKTD